MSKKMMDDCILMNLLMLQDIAWCMSFCLIEKCLDELARLVGSSGCSWEGAHVDRYISIDVPKSVDYLPIKRLLDEGVRAGEWDYKEACLSDSHSY